MKKILVSVLAVLLVAGAAYAATPTQNDDVYKDLDQLKLQIRKMKLQMSGLMKEITTDYSSDSKALIEGWGQDIRIDVTENDKDVLVRADLPGMDKDKIDIMLEGGKVLKISGMRSVEKKEEAPGMVRQERMEGRFERILELPAECKSEGISASYNNGVLEITIPRKESVKKEMIKIKVR